MPQDREFRSAVPLRFAAADQAVHCLAAQQLHCAPAGVHHPGLRPQLPFNIGASQFSNVSFWTGNDTLTGDFLTPRKHQAFRAVDHPFYFFTPLTADFSNRRLVGRSVWNTGWKLVIPANTLLNNTSDGLSRFLKSVKDIQLYVRSYSYSGN